MKILKFLPAVVLAALISVSCETPENQQATELSIEFTQPEAIYLGQTVSIPYTLSEKQPTAIDIEGIADGWTVEISNDPKTININCDYQYDDGGKNCKAQIVLYDGKKSAKFPLDLECTGENYYVLEISAKDGSPLVAMSPSGYWVLGRFNQISYINKVGTTQYESYNYTVSNVSDEGIIDPPIKAGEASVGYRNIKVDVNDNGSQNSFHIPTITIDGVTSDLPQPETDYSGRTPQQLYSGHIAKEISSDRKVVIGYLDDMMGARLLVIWKLNEQSGEYEYNFVKKDMFEYDYSAEKWLEYTGNISSNGRYIACSYIKDNIYHAARYDVENDELYYVQEPSDAFGNKVTPDGKLFLSTPALSRLREGYVYEEGKNIVTFKYWMKQNYNIELPNNNCTLAAFNKDWTSFAWHVFETSGYFNYILTNRDILKANGVEK